MNRLAELRQRREKLVKEMRAIADAPAGENGDLSADQNTTFEARKRDLETTEAAITREQDLQEAERRSHATARLAGGNPVQGDTFASEVRSSFSLCRALIHAGFQPVHIPRGFDAGREIEMMDEVRNRNPGRQWQGIAIPTEVFCTRATPMEKRVVTSGGGSGAGVISTDLLDGQYIDRLRNALVTASLGATVLSDLHGNVAIPKNTSSNTAAWFAENTAITAADKSFGQVTLSPKHCGMITEYSRNLLLQSSPDIEMLLRQDFAAELAVAIDQAAMNGVNDGKTPVGIMNTVGVTGMSVAITWSAILDLIADIESANVQMTGWATSAESKKRMMGTPKQSSGVEGNFIMNEPSSLAGYPVRVSQILRTDQSPDFNMLIAGRWSDLLLGYWSGVDLLTNPYESTAYSKGNVQVRGIITADVAVRYPESFSFIA